MCRGCNGIKIPQVLDVICLFIAKKLLCDGHLARVAARNQSHDAGHKCSSCSEGGVHSTALHVPFLDSQI
jgi:hypothetical protein